MRLNKTGIKCFVPQKCLVSIASPTQCLQWDLFSDKYIGCSNQYKTGHVSSEAKNGKNKETSNV